MITTIIFDLGNVILTNDWHDNQSEKFREYSDYFGINYNSMESGWEASWPRFCIGKINEDEFWKEFLETAGANNLDIEYAKKLYRKYQRPIENMFSLLNKLKQHYRLAALTTISKEWLNYKREKYNLDSYFELIVSSGYFGLTKTNQKIYETVIEKLRVRPQECLFVDDQENPLLFAQKLGMKTVLFSNQLSLEKTLKEFGIKF